MTKKIYNTVKINIYMSAVEQIKDYISFTCCVYFPALIFYYLSGSREGGVIKVSMDLWEIVSSLQWHGTGACFLATALHTQTHLPAANWVLFRPTLVQKFPEHLEEVCRPPGGMLKVKNRVCGIEAANTWLHHCVLIVSSREVTSPVRTVWREAELKMCINVYFYILTI